MVRETIRLMEFHRGTDQQIEPNHKTHKSTSRHYEISEREREGDGETAGEKRGMVAQKIVLLNKKRIYLFFFFLGYHFLGI